MTDVQVPTDVLRCPVHGIPDCSPLLNGCSIPKRRAEAYRAGYSEATAQAGAAALREAARFFEYEMSKAWGGDSSWISTGTHVADLVADVLRERARDVDDVLQREDDPR